jgi:type II secretory pathway pseudopilin PulG
VTLVEMLVTIGVIALLLGLLMPALASVRAAAKASICQSNQRQMSTAAWAHVAQQDAFPAALAYVQVDGMLVQRAWDWETPAFGEGLIGPGLLWRFTNPGEAMQCAVYEGPANAPGDPFTGYNYNTSFIGDEEAFTTSGDGPVRRGVRPAHCRRASMCAMFGCGGYGAGANKFMRAPSLQAGGESLAAVYAGAQAYRHAGETVVCYIDGHVGKVGRAHAGEHATEAMLGLMGFPKNGFLSADDAMYDPR